eukprot:Opistho-2@13978
MPSHALVISVCACVCASDIFLFFLFPVCACLCVCLYRLFDIAVVVHPRLAASAGVIPWGALCLCVSVCACGFPAHFNTLLPTALLTVQFYLSSFLPRLSRWVCAQCYCCEVSLSLLM